VKDNPASRRAIPHVREFLADALTPLAVYRRLRGQSEYSFLFESVTGGEQVSRYSLMGAAPSEIYHLHQDRLEEVTPLAGAQSARALDGLPLDALRRVLGSVKTEKKDLAARVPFTGGFVGYFGWDLVRLVEELPNRPPDPFEIPIAVLARFDQVVVFDHAQQRVLGIANEIDGLVSSAEAEAQLDGLAALLAQGDDGGAVALPAQRPPAIETGEPSLSDQDFMAAIETAKEYIAAGDIFQVVLARRFEIDHTVDPLALYRALRVVNPSPYMVLIEGPDATLVGASPEMLVRVVDGRLEMRPIAGTRPRGANADEDRHLAEELLADPKERAEHVMLVDLGRNDLGRVAGPGKVRVEEFMVIENYSHVMHIVSSVEADLEGELEPLDALLATFPAGTLSGAPKIRAMEIIDQLEPEARGVYGGAAGYFSFTGDMDTCIAIRTLVMAGGFTSVTAGAGIVADSDPATEAQESRDKAAALLHAVALAQHLEAATGEGSGR
jgi:anthranilate synthase component 1